MTISSSFVLFLTLLTCCAAATAGSCPEAKDMKPIHEDNCKGDDNENCKAVLQYDKDGNYFYWCEWAYMVVEQGNTYKNVKYVECDSSGKLNVTYGTDLIQPAKLNEKEKIFMKCIENRACTTNPELLQKNKCHFNDCIAANTTTNFLRCDDESYQMEYLDEKHEVWVESDFLYCTDNTIIGHKNNPPFRCRKRRNKSCNLDEYYDDSQCPATAICSKPATDGTCIEGKLKFLYQSWISKSITCVASNTSEWFMEKKLPIASPEGIACLVEDKCAADLTGIQCLDNACKEATLLKSDDHTLTCEATHYLEVKKDDWHYVNAARCFGKAIHPLVNDRPNTAEKYSSARCRKQRTCSNPSEYYGNSVCDQSRVCEQPNSGFTCRAGFSLKYTSDLDPNKWLDANSVECTNNKAILTIEKVKSTIVPLHIRCMKEKGCDLQYFNYGTDCSDDLICKMPSSKADKSLQCDSDDFGLQAKFDNSWIDLGSASCADDKRFKLVDKKGTEISKYMEAFRCVHINIAKKFDNYNCGKNKQYCEEPQHCAAMKCKDQWGLLIKLPGMQWSEVQSASCNSATFKGKINGEEFDTSEAKVKCARHWCSECNNPCSNCLGSEFTDNKKWNECTKFSCGPNTRTIFAKQKFDKATLTCDKVDNRKNNYWKVETVANAANSVQCEKLCTLSNKLKTECDVNDKYCGEAKINNDEDYSNCEENKKMFYDVGNAGPVEISDLKCDIADGNWRALAETNSIIVPKGSNVQCHYGCDYELYYKEQCDADNDCEKLQDFNNNEEKCKDDYGLQINFGAQNGLGWTNVQGVACVKNRFKAKKNSRDMEAFPEEIRCIRKILTNFFEGSDCKDALCTQPTNCAPIKCDPMSLLHIKSGSNWKEVDSARCDSDKFTYKEKGSTAEVAENSVKGKCVRMKCTLCENPCPTCKSEFNAVFSQSTKWDECAKFECGKNTRTTFDPDELNPEARENAKLECIPVDNGQAIWSLIGEDLKAQKVKCEKLCTKINILDNKCDPKDFHCIKVNLEDDKALECGNRLFFTDDQNQMIETSELKCDKEEGVWKAQIDGQTEKTVLKQGSKVYCHLGCDIQKFFVASLCPDKSECKEPKLSPDPHCETEFGLQAKFERDVDVWIDISKITCDNNKFQAFDHDDAKIDRFPYNFRCIRKKIDHFFSKDVDCDDEKECKAPENCASLTCENQWALQISKSVIAPIDWEVVDSLRCDSDEFKSKDWKVVRSGVTKIRCTRLKCTQCPNPCEDCLANGKLDGVAYKESTKWDECSDFTCGKHTRAVFDEITRFKFYDANLVCNSFNLRTQGAAIWEFYLGNIMFGGETKSVKCENSCMLHQPLKSECLPNDFCVEWDAHDDIPNDCSLKKFYNTVQENKKILVPIKNLACKFDDGSWEVTRGDGITEALPKDISLECHAGCHIEHYFKPCEDENECKKPIETDDKTQSCDVDYGLQVDFGSEQTPSGWQDVSSVKCEGHRFKAYDKQDAKIAAFPKGIRCIRKNIKHFFKACDTETERCESPKNCSSLECEPQWALQMEFEANKWSVVESASCDSHEFTIKPLNGEISRARQPTGVRCIILQCTYCTNPCPDCHPQSSAIYKNSSGWDQCAEFTCGEHADIVKHEKDKEKEKLEKTNITCKNVENNNINFWTAKDGSVHQFSKNITCENSCKDKSPLISSCDKNDTKCVEIPDSLPDVFNCDDRKTFLVPPNGVEERIKNLKCKTEEGIYEAQRISDDTPVNVPKGSNVYCHAGDCDISRIFPTCEQDNDEICDEIMVNDVTTFYCNAEYMFWSRESEKHAWKKMEGVKELKCIAGSIANGEKKMSYDFQARCRLPFYKAKPADMTAVYFIVPTLAMIFVVPLIASVCMRIAGVGWLHTVIIDRMRRKIKKRKRRAQRNAKKTKTPKTPRTQPSSEATSIASSVARTAPKSETPIEKRTRASPSPSSDVTSEEPRSILNEDPNPNVVHV